MRDRVEVTRQSHKLKYGGFNSPFRYYAGVTQWLESRLSKPNVEGSSPFSCLFFSFFYAKHIVSFKVLHDFAGV